MALDSLCLDTHEGAVMWDPDKIAKFGDWYGGSVSNKVVPSNDLKNYYTARTSFYPDYMNPCAEIKMPTIKLKKKKFRGACFKVSPELLHEALGIPEGHEICQVSWDFTRNAISMQVKGPDLPEVEDGCLCSTIEPTVVATFDGTRMQYKWDWNLGSMK